LNYLHDHDGCTKSVIGKKFPKANELLCNSHFIKNKIKKLNGEWKLRVKKSLFYIIKKSNDRNECDELIKRYENHFLNNHEFCENCILKDYKITDATHEAIKKIYTELSKKIYQLIHGKSTSKVEGVNGAIMHDTPKSTSFPKMYDTKVDGTLSRLSNGELYVEPILKQLKTPINNKSIELLKKLDKNREKQSLNQSKKEYKNKKYENKARLNNINKSTNKEYYKPRVHAIENNNENICSCKTGCKNRKCGCFKLGFYCNPRCGCVKHGNCTNHE
jgi:hypothetical protein